LRTFGLQSAAAPQRTFDFMTGKLSVPQSEMMAGLFGGARSWMAASQMGSAVIPAVFVDSATSIRSAQLNGMDGMKVISRALSEMMADPETARMAAARMISSALSEITAA
jgi:hypothetical protein